MDERLKYRLRFAKMGRAAYISHLDLMRCMQRAFLRAGLPLKYSEGFNPHALISILLPLPLGEESLCELMDFRLCEAVRPADIAQKLQEALPEGIEALGVTIPAMKAKELKYVRVEGLFAYDRLDAGESAVRLTDFFRSERIDVRKRGKNGESVVDIAPQIRGIGFEAVSGGVKVRAVLSAQEPTLSPELLVAALGQIDPAHKPAAHQFRRIENYTARMELFT